MKQSYPIPAKRCRIFETISRSRFITTIGHAPDDAAAKKFIREIKNEFSDASHNCWAYQLGPPGYTSSIGVSDDGEPHGTAGRPMLTVLVHAGVGEIVAVVTRYFGGVKLGKGGLVRAYTSGVKNALEQLSTTRRQEFEDLTVLVEYQHLRAVQGICRGLDARILDEAYKQEVSLKIEIKKELLEIFKKRMEKFLLTG